ncbi:MAG: phospholipase D-like domain-containing protein [Candidatus Brocadiia bacterium]
MRIIYNPTDDWIKKQISLCRHRFLVASPFVTGIFAEHLSGLRASVDRSLLTRLLIRDFSTGASDLEAVRSIASIGVRVYSESSLHAKVYIVDGAAALVTSANATYSGLRNNAECGIETTDPAQVEELACAVLHGFKKDGAPRLWPEEEISGLQTPVMFVREKLKSNLMELVADAQKNYMRIRTSADRNALADSLGGWAGVTLHGIMALGAEFSLSDVYDSCEEEGKQKYPGNKNWKAKLRQQLQVLRDMGFVEFLGGGHYRRLVGE